MNFHSACAVLAMAAVLWPNAAAAQPTSSLAELGWRPMYGQTWIVMVPQGWEIKGVVRSLSSDTLVLDAKGSRMSFAESEVQAIRSPSHRRRNAWLGAGIGLLIACIGTEMADRRYDDSVYTWLYFGTWLLPAVGASVGAATGGSKTLFLLRAAAAPRA